MPHLNRPMLETARWLTLAIAPATVWALSGCPALSEIGVGGGDAGFDARADAQRDATGDAEPRDRHAGDAPQEAGGCSTDLTTDPKNCGRCAHDCRGGECAAGVCQPYAIVSGNPGPYGVAVRDGVVYFTSSDGTVERCAADDCANTLTQMTSGQAIPRGITTDTTSVYWANEGFVADGGFMGSIATCGLAGCPSGVATVLAPLEAAPYDLAVNIGQVFWTDDFGKEVRSCALGGCGGAPATVATDVNILSGVAIDATSIFWAEPKAGNLMKCPLAGCATLTPFASYPSSLFTQIDIAGGSVYWSTADTVLRCPTSGCAGAPEVFAKNQPGAYAIAHDATHLYWTLSTLSGRVLRCALAGCPAPTVVADLQAGPTSVAVDSASVYWANSGGHTVMRWMK